MTGIDRVEYALAHWLLNRASQDQGEKGFMINNRMARAVLKPARAKQLLDKISRRRGAHQPVDDLLAQLFENLSGNPGEGNQIGATRLSRAGASASFQSASWPVAIEAMFAFGSVANFLGRHRGQTRYIHASHHGLQWSERFDWIARYDVDATFYIHDLIPIDFPQYCSAGAHVSHKRKLETVARYATRIAVNSEDTAHRLTHYYRSISLRSPPIEVHRLGSEPLSPVEMDIPRGLLTASLKPYFLCAGTLEGRKNLPLLLKTWRILASRLRPHEMPRLVLAGQRGWHAAELFQDLDGMRDIAPFVLEVNGLNDAEMGFLMEGACAVITPSFAEGYSLVPAEAMRRGVRVILSDIPAHRELASDAGDLAQLFDASSAEALTRILVENTVWNRLAPLSGRSWLQFAQQLCSATNLIFDDTLDTLEIRKM